MKCLVEAIDFSKKTLNSHYPSGRTSLFWNPRGLSGAIAAVPIPLDPSFEKQLRIPHFSMRLSKSKLRVEPDGVVTLDSDVVSSIEALVVTFRSGQLMLDFEVEGWIWIIWLLFGMTILIKNKCDIRTLIFFQVSPESVPQNANWCLL